MNCRYLLSLVLLTLIIYPSQAQINDHLIGSPFGGVSSISLNPAINNHNKTFEFNLYNFNWKKDFFSSNYYDSKVNDLSTIREDYKMVFTGVMFTTDVKAANRTHQWGFGLSNHRYGTFRYETESQTSRQHFYQNNQDRDFTNQNVSQYRHQYADLGLTVAYNLIATKRMQFNLGATVKQIRGEHLQIGYVRGMTRQFPSESIQNSYFFNYRNPDWINDGENAFQEASLFTKAEDDQPTSFAGDFGFEFQVRKAEGVLRYVMDDSARAQEDINQTLFKIGGSISNVGANLEYQRGDADVTADGVYALNTSGVSDDFKLEVSVPQNLLAYVDFSLGKVFSMNMNFRQFSYQTFDGSEYVSKKEQTIGIIPRFEKKGVGVYVPVQYGLESDRGNVEIGAAMRIYWLSFRLDNLMTYFSDANTPSGMQLGVFIPIHRKMPKDTDKDWVSDELDECPNDAGFWYTKGCPDADGDSVPDRSDLCAFEFGTRATYGCPDKDGDGIRDSEDECDSIFGVEAFKGCPDTDGDGVPDKEDRCELDPGPAEEYGCPDTDGDGLFDHEDVCDEEFGLPIHKGCPIDSDNDGIYDHEDNCPTQAGDRANKGCPYSDKDRFDAKMFTFTEDFMWDVGAGTISNDRSLEILDEVVDFVDDNMDYILTITILPEDSTATSIELAEERVDVLVRMLLDTGLDDSRLEIEVAENEYFEGKFTKFSVRLEDY